jgi:hypothetical protein
VRFRFRALPDPGASLLRARLIVDVVADGSEDFAWTGPVWFCDPWIPSFGLLGLTGFFDHFKVTIASYEEWIELTPIS